MKIDRHQKRLGAIKLKYVFFSTKCEHCGNEYIRETMYSVQRWGINKRVFTWYYCQNCFHSKEEILKEIDTDTGFGIAFIDDFGHYPEKDYTKIHNMINSLPNPNGHNIYST